MASNKDVILKRIKDGIDNIKNKDFTLYFYTIDCKNTPNGKAFYTYNLAKTLSDLGYNVCMVYQIENEYTEEELKELDKKNLLPDENRIFRGVDQWLGEEYGKLKHMNIQSEEWKVGPWDFFFIPEVLASIMYLTFKNKIPCKRYVILNNYDYITEFIPFGQQWANYGIDHVIASTQYQADKINDIFPYTKGHTTILPPFIPNCFRKPLKPQKLIVNIISKNQDNVNRIIKNFYWKYPSYQFISFRDVRGLNENAFADTLKEGAITIWVDDDTSFGYSALEAIRCNNILIAKIPEVLQGWMIDHDGNLKNNAIWFNNIYDSIDLLAKVISSWMVDAIPEDITKSMEETNKLYTYDEWTENVEEFIENACQERIDEFKVIYDEAESNKETDNTDKEVKE